MFYTTRSSILKLWFCGVLLLGLLAPISSYAQYQREKNGELSDFDNLYEELKEQKSLPTQIVFEINIFEIILSDSVNVGFLYDVFGENGHFRGTNLAGDPTREIDLGVLGSGNRNELLPAGANVVTKIFESDDNFVEAIFQALAEDQVIKVHANPIVLTIAGVPVHLESGDDVPFLERTSLNNNETFGSQWRNTGVTLNLTSQVEYTDTDVERKNPLILVELDTNLSSVTRYREEEGFAQPIIDTRNYQTTVRLRSNQRILIGALFRDSKGNRGREIPILRDLPVLGRLFRSTSTSSVLSQLFIMIRPSIFDVWSSGGESEILMPKEEFERIGEMLDEKNRQREAQRNWFDDFKEIFLEGAAVKK